MGENTVYFLDSGIINSAVIKICDRKDFCFYSMNKTGIDERIYHNLGKMRQVALLRVPTFTSPWVSVKIVFDCG